MIKILSGHTEKGGSTIAFINLTNFFNKNGIETIFYGLHAWHLDKCKSDLIQKAVLCEKDIVISHFLSLKQRPNVRKIVLSSHEKWWFDFGTIFQYWDEAVFLHQMHRDYHFKYKGKFRIIPNLKENLVPGDKTSIDKIAGIIGTIYPRKQTHVSIKRALADNCEKIYLIGSIADSSYFSLHVAPLMKEHPNVVLAGYQDDKQRMYDRLGRVYHSSNGEVACLVKDECYLTNTKFFGNEETENEVSPLTNEEILELWKNCLEI